MTAISTAPTGLTLEAISSLPDPELIARYRSGLESFDGRLFDLSDEQADLAYPSDAGVGLWSARTLVGHLADAELAFTHRMRRALAEDNPVVALWDENAFVGAGLYQGGQHPLPAFVAVIHTLRRWTAGWLTTLTPEQLVRKILHPERGELTVRRMLAMTTWHLEHHARFLNAKVCRLLGPAPADEETAGGGCGPGCGCHKR
jgi:uncharacterized damage-inducible protein DinB